MADEDRTALKMFAKSRNQIATYSNRFREIFGMDLKRFYGDNALEMMLGFDIIKFGDEISKRHCGGQPDWSEISSPFSLKEIVLCEYKQAGVDLMNILIS